MTPDAYERLLSDWLDQPTPELAARLEAAAVADAQLARLRETWLRIDATLRHPYDLQRVNWPAFHASVRAAVAAEAARSDDRRLDRALGTLPDILPIIDWDRLKQRIGDSVSASVAADPPPGRAIRFPRKRRAAAGALLALAAALALFALIPRTRTSLPLGGGVARIMISSVAVATAAAPRVELSIATLDEAPPAPSDGDEEIFLMIDPIDTPPALATLHDRVGFY